MRRTASGSKLRSMRVFALETVSSVFEYTTLSAARQISAKSLICVGSSAVSRVSHATNTSYIRRPKSIVPTGRARSLTKAWTSASGSAQSKLPSSSATKPSSDASAA
jgi:hypothetical protein